MMFATDSCMYLKFTLLREGETDKEYFYVYETHTLHSVDAGYNTIIFFSQAEIDVIEG